LKKNDFGNIIIYEVSGFDINEKNSERLLIKTINSRMTLIEESPDFSIDIRAIALNEKETIEKIKSYKLLFDKMKQ